MKAFLRTQVNLDGKQSVKLVFSTIIRKLISPTALRNYSWKGQCKVNSAQKGLKSFKASFKNIINMVFLLCREGDPCVTMQIVGDCFFNMLRNKNTDIKRSLKHHGEKREANVRVIVAPPKKRKRKIVVKKEKPAICYEDLTIDQDSTATGHSSTIDGNNGTTVNNIILIFLRSKPIYSYT